MKHVTIALTAAALSASLFGLNKPVAAQSPDQLTAKGYDAGLVAASLTAPTSDETAILAAVNALREQNGVPDLAP
ncbi:MAG: hypothetical protein JO250_17580, partial [Armatimonadetes bacterium]|nr:hypothetical protein [Armatimonadota bacterium]